MPITALTEKTYLVIDNCVLSMLTDCFCDGNKRLSGMQLLRATQEWMTDQLNILKLFSIDSLLHTTQAVSNEYQPQNGSLGIQRVDRRHIRDMANQVKNQFHNLETNPASTQYLRDLPQAPKRLVNPANGLSDEDMSLIHLGLHLTQHGHKVILLSNDQDLLQFSSWVRAQTCLRKPPTNPLNLEGRLCLAYLDLIHRSCEISTEQMGQFISYMIADTGRRMAERDAMALNPQKGARILEQIAAIQQIFTQSTQIKAQNQGVLA